MPDCHNDEVIARVLQEDSNSNLARDLQLEENSNIAKELQKRYTKEQIDSNYNMAKKLQEIYYKELDKDIPVIQKKKIKEEKKVVSHEISFMKLFNELLPFLLLILLIVYLSTFMFSSNKKGRKK